MIFPSVRSASVRSTVVGLALCVAGLLAAPAFAATSGIAGFSFSALPASVKPATDVTTGAFNSAKMSVDVVLAPRNASQLSSLLMNLADPNSPSYRQWLRKGQFNALFAPSTESIAAVAGYLRASGLVLEQSSSPFFVRASGSSSAVAAAFRTSFRSYRNRSGISYFSNASTVQLPATLAANVLGVVGLSSTVHEQPQFKRPMTHSSSKPPGCEAPYPTAAQLYNAVNNGVGFPFGYGGAPGCNGLTPSQDNSLYGAPNVGPSGKGAGVNLAVFELSAYQHSDIATWAHTFYGAGYTPPLVDVTVDGGPLNPVCPTLDVCPPAFNFYAGDIEVDADIETQLAISPAASHILVYNAPNDVTGRTSLDEYAKIASDDTADVVSSSWAVCENDLSPAFVQAENLIFEQMALQGQSMFAASGDTGAFGCIRSDGTDIPNLIDPSAQPWVTGVGGTSFESFNPGAAKHPVYPAGIETVWNVVNLCNSSADEGGQTGFFWCAVTGAGGGGNSQYWGRPHYQFGPGIANKYSRQCALAGAVQPCREVPDISANADEYTPYGEYCTANKNTRNSACAFAQTPFGWFGIGGTSLSSPLLSAIFADRDSFLGTRSGNVNPLLYLLYNLDPHGYFNDITGAGQTTNNNGLFPTLPGYDLATGIGTPKMAPIITGFPAK